MLKRNTKVKWPSLHNDNKVFTGTVRRVVDDRVIIDDGSGRTFRVVRRDIVIPTK